MRPPDITGRLQSCCPSQLSESGLKDVQDWDIYPENSIILIQTTTLRSP